MRVPATAVVSMLPEGGYITLPPRLLILRLSLNTLFAEFTRGRDTRTRRRDGGVPESEIRASEMVAPVVYAERREWADSVAAMAMLRTGHREYYPQRQSHMPR